MTISRSQLFRKVQWTTTGQVCPSARRRSYARFLECPASQSAAAAGRRRRADATWVTMMSAAPAASALYATQFTYFTCILAFVWCRRRLFTNRIGGHWLLIWRNWKMRWTVQGLAGGPRRVNHASVAVGKFIYSFGGKRKRLVLAWS